MNRHPIAVSVFLLLPVLVACDGSAPPGDALSDQEPPELIQVAERGDLAALDALLKRDPHPDVRDSCDWTPLMKAAMNGHTQALERLLAAGAAVDAEDKGGYTAAMLAASNNRAAIVARLAEHGAMLDHQERTLGWSALIWAAKQGHRETVEVLLARGVDTSLKDYSGRTAADWAKETGQGAVLDLLTAGAKPRPPIRQ
jgi:uncharacterized protein